MEKWKDEIEELLSKNRTVDRWIIRDLVWQEDNPAHKTMLDAMSHLMTAMRLLRGGPCAISETELKERIKRSCAEAGLPKEAINGFFTWFDRQEIADTENRSDSATDEETNEPFGDDE